MRNERKSGEWEKGNWYETVSQYYGDTVNEPFIKLLYGVTLYHDVTVQRKPWYRGLEKVHEGECREIFPEEGRVVREKIYRLWYLKK